MRTLLLILARAYHAGTFRDSFGSISVVSAPLRNLPAGLTHWREWYSWMGSNHRPPHKLCLVPFGAHGRGLTF
jgi:hypothetical protein